MEIASLLRVPLWSLLLVVGALLLAVAVLPRFARLRSASWFELVAVIAYFLAQAIALLATNAAYAFAPIGSDAVRVVPLLQFDPALLGTSWLPDQLALGATNGLMAALAFPRRLRNAWLVAVVFAGFGIEVNQAIANTNGLIPAFRIDVHDVLVRVAGVSAGVFLLARTRRTVLARAAVAARRPYVTMHAASQAPAAVLMVKPLGFNPNPETAADNAFQAAPSTDPGERRRLAAAAAVETAVVANALRGAGVEVLLVEDHPGSDLPDSVFPNNWISTHEDGRVVLYPMAHPSRRRERRSDVVDALRTRWEVQQVLDLSPLEADGRYLEGTGALVLDHVNRIAYMARSGRAHEAALDQWCDAMGYTAEVFDTVDAAGQPIYHTNVVLTIATDFVLAGLDCIPDPAERARVAARLTETGRELIALDRRQVAEFAGNALELTGGRGRVLALSTRAAAALRPDQVAAIEHSAALLPIAIPTVEMSGGSVRCMLAGIHLPPKRPAAPEAPGATGAPAPGAAA